MAKNEKKIQTLILTDLRSFGRYCDCSKIIKTSDNGFPDIFFSTVLTGVVLVETKRLKGSLQAIQVVRISNLNKCGTRTFLCHSWEEWMSIKERLKLTLENIKHAQLPNIKKS